MKVLPFKIPKPDHDILVYQVDKEKSFYGKLHQHEEIQISYIVEGEGTLLVGDSVNYYSKGDILIIGSFLPHVFKSDTTASMNSHMLSLFFTKNSFGKGFFQLEELTELRKFFKRSKHGFKVSSRLRLMKHLFTQLEQASKLERFIILLELQKLASRANYKSLSSFIYDKKFTDIEGNRMRNIFEFTMNNFKKNISLDTISDVANMTKNAFCKYFKRRTNKTYIEFLNEIRIEHACKLILSKLDATIADISYQSGFNNISNFNRQFKMVKQMSPSAFKKLSL